jgi:predicted deacylase
VSLKSLVGTNFSFKATLQNKNEPIPGGIQVKKDLTVAGVTAKPGEKAYGVVPIPDVLANGQTLEMPFILMNGSEDGPWLYVQVAQHASEVHALEAIRRVLADLDPKTLSGALTFCLPNGLGLSFPEVWDAMTPKMNRVGFGDPKGTITERITNTWWTNFVIDKVDYVIDFHTGRAAEPAWIFYEGQGVTPGASPEVIAKAEHMAEVFGTELLYKETESYGGSNTFRASCVDHGIPAIVPEMDGHSRFVESIVQIAVRGLKNVMIDIGLMKGKVELPPKQYVLKWVIDEREAGVINSKGGIFATSVKVGDMVKKGDKVGIIYSPKTLKVIETLAAHRDGYVFRVSEDPVMNAGEATVSIVEILQVIENK